MKIIGVRTVGEMLEAVKNPEQFEKMQSFGGENQKDKGSETENQEEKQVDFSRNLRAGKLQEERPKLQPAAFIIFYLQDPPGTGKTMLAKRIPTIMPSLTFEESLELTRIYSIAGLLSPNTPLVKKRPFRCPHHTSPPPSLAGGGRVPKPGEVTLAHKGVLFLDEMPEFSRRSLEVLRQPLEDKTIQLSRASGTYTFPAGFILVAAMNPCPCGYYPDLNRCRCTPGQISHYLHKISQPLLDRIDLCVEVPPVKFSQINRRRKR